MATQTKAAAPRVSFEFFPPKTEKMEAQFWDAVGKLAPLKPGFVSVTYGAGGSTRERTHSIVTRVQERTGIPAAAHLTCVAASREEIDAIADAYWDAGIRHLVALRGDPPGFLGGAYVPQPDGYAYASDLVQGLRARHDFEISVAAYPEAHPQAESPAHDIENLKRKVDAGATRAITQFFFDIGHFRRFRDAVAAAGIKVNLVPGILPVQNFVRTKEIAASCGTEIPQWFEQCFTACEDDPVKRDDVAADIAVELCRALLGDGIGELHFYTLNKADLTLRICERIGVSAL
jgi:methylenetetrahydrofolate reductase (NADPH)